MIDSTSWRGIETLVVSPSPTHPQDHGNRKRIFEVCRALQRRGAKIHFLHYPSEHDWRYNRPIGPEAAMAAQWDSYQLVAPSRPLHPAAAKEDHEIDEWADPAVSQYLAWACAKRRYDVAIVNYTWMSFALDAIPSSVFKVLDTHDIFADRRQMLQKLNVSPEFFHTTRAEETRGLRRADLVWAIKDAEREYFVRNLGIADCLTLLHNEPQRDGWRLKPSHDGWLRVGVIGARNNVNRRNLERFLEAALPVFFKYMAPVKIVIAGGCSDDFRKLSHANIEVVGRVPDVDAFYRSVDVVIAPLEISTGLKIKVGEALANGVPLVAHRHAMDGYPSAEPLHCLHSFEAMAVELAKLSFERAPLAKLAKRARRVCADIQASVDAALTATRARIAAKIGANVCLIAPIEALDPRSLLRDHFHAAVDCIRDGSNIEVFLLGQTGCPNLEVLESYDLQHRVFVDPSVRDRLGVSAPEAWMPATLLGLLSERGYGRAYIMADCREALTSGAGALKQIYVRHDMVELGGGDADALAERLRQLADVCLIGSAPARILPWRDRSNVGAVLCAPVRRSGAFCRLKETLDEPLDILLLAGAHDPVAEGITDLCRRLRAKWRTIDPADPATARAVVRRPDVADPLAGLGQARILVDLTPQPTSLSAAIGEAALRQGIPHVVLVRGAQALGLWRFPDQLRPASVGQLLRTIAEALIAPAALREAAARELYARTANDAGWTELSRRLAAAGDDVA